MTCTTIVGLTLIIEGVTLLGCCRLVRKVLQLEEENRMLNDLLDKMLLLDELSVKVVREYVEANKKSKQSPGMYITPRKKR